MAKVTPISNLALGEVGLINDADVTFQECAFVRWDYQGKLEEVTALRIVMVADDGSEHPQYFSVGAGDVLMPTKDGKALYSPENRRSVVANNSNYGKFIRSLMTPGGITEDELRAIGFETDISSLDGTRAHIIRVPANRENMPGEAERRKERGGREAEVVQVSKVYSLGKSGKRKAKAKAKADSGDADDQNVEAAVMAFILQTLQDNNGRMDVEDLLLEASTGLDRSIRREAKELINDDDFLAGLTGVSLQDGALVLSAGKSKAKTKAKVEPEDEDEDDE